MEKYYNVVVQVRTTDEKGKVKKNNELYLIKDVSCLAAETKTVKYFTDKGYNLDYTITSDKNKT